MRLYELVHVHFVFLFLSILCCSVHMFFSTLLQCFCLQRSFSSAHQSATLPAYTFDSYCAETCFLLLITSKLKHAIENRKQKHKKNGSKKVFREYWPRTYIIHVVTHNASRPIQSAEQLSRCAAIYCILYIQIRWKLYVYHRQHCYTYCRYFTA